VEETSNKINRVEPSFPILSCVQNILDQVFSFSDLWMNWVF
jgi:hypothetical protein